MNWLSGRLGGERSPSDSEESSAERAGWGTCRPCPCPRIPRKKGGGRPAWQSLDFREDPGQQESVSQSRTLRGQEDFLSGDVPVGRKSQCGVTGSEKHSRNSQLVIIWVSWVQAREVSTLQNIPGNGYRLGRLGSAQ